MNAIDRTARRVQHPLKMRLLQVARVESLSPRMKRVVLGGDALTDFVSAAADDHVKLFFPADARQKPVLPDPDAPAGAPRPLSRDYTPRRFDAHRRELTIDFVLHGDGPAASWAAQAAPGQWLGVGGPRGSFLADDEVDCTLLIGDETALPPIARRLEEMPTGARALVLIDVADEQEEHYLPTAANADIRWLFRHGAPAGDPSRLQQALDRLPWPHGRVAAWLAGEIEAMRHLRQWLITERGLPPHAIRAAGYWRHGTAGAHGRIDG